MARRRRIERRERPRSAFRLGQALTLSPLRMPRSVKPALAHLDRVERGSARGCVLSSCGCISSMLMMRPSGAMKAIESGMNVFFIQNA